MFRASLSKGSVPALTAAGLLTPRASGSSAKAASCEAPLCIQSSVSFHRPLPVSKLRSVIVREAHASMLASVGTAVKARHFFSDP